MTTPLGGESTRHVVAVVRGFSGSIEVETNADGRLPRVDADWPDVSDLLPGRRLLPLAPRIRIGDENLHVLADLTGAGEVWTSLAAIAESEELRGAIARAVAQWNGDAPAPERRGSWYRRGWLDHVGEWIATQTGGTDGELLGDPSVIKMWPLSALARFPTRRRDVVVKASCEHFRAEPMITAALADIAPDVMPDVIAIDADLTAMRAFDPTPAEGTPALDRLLVAAAEAIATVQTRSLGALDRLRSAGAPLRGAKETITAFADVLSHGAEIELLSASERARLRAHQESIAGKVEELHAAGLSLAVIHGDLHGANVAVHPSSGGPVLFDWSDSAVAHPSLDLAHLTRGRDDAVSEAMWTAWADV